MISRNEKRTTPDALCGTWRGGGAGWRFFCRPCQACTPEPGCCLSIPATACRMFSGCFRAAPPEGLANTFTHEIDASSGMTRANPRRFHRSGHPALLAVAPDGPWRGARPLVAWGPEGSSPKSRAVPGHSGGSWRIGMSRRAAADPSCSYDPHMDAQPTPDGPHGGELNDELEGGRTPSNRSVAVVMAAHDEASRIALTVIAARRLPGVDLVVVVDTGSTDSTARVAEESGAEVIRLGARADRTAALLRGAARVAELELLESARPGAAGAAGAGPTGAAVAGSGRSAPRHLLFLEPDVQSGAAEAVRLLEPVQAGEADAALAREGSAVPWEARRTNAVAGDGRAAREAGPAARRARRGIERATGFSVGRPVVAELCLTREALAAAEPLSGGAGAAAGLIIDLMRRGFRVTEAPVDWSHRPRRGGVRGGLREFGQWREVGRTLSSRR